MNSGALDQQRSVPMQLRAASEIRRRGVDLFIAVANSKRDCRSFLDRLWFRGRDLDKQRCCRAARAVCVYAIYKLLHIAVRNRSADRAGNSVSPTKMIFSAVEDSRV
jgi:hypothetical protein